MPREPQYLPTNDLLFKRIIGNASHPDVTRGFICDMLGFEVGAVSVQNPYDISWFRDSLGGIRLQATIVDVLVELSDGSQAVVEMQVARHSHFPERMLYNTSRRFVEGYGDEQLLGQAGGGSKYGTLRPAHGIAVLGFTLFPGDTDPLRRYALFDREHGDVFGAGAGAAGGGGLMSLVLLELTKPRQAAPPGVAQWMDFFKGEEAHVEVPDYIRKAYKLADVQSMSREEIELLISMDMAAEDRKGQLAYAREEGLEQGLAEGRAEGRAEVRSDVARSALLKGLDAAFVADITGLSLDAVERLQGELA